MARKRKMDTAALRKSSAQVTWSDKPKDAPPPKPQVQKDIFGNVIKGPVKAKKLEDWALFIGVGFVGALTIYAMTQPKTDNVITSQPAAKAPPTTQPTLPDIIGDKKTTGSFGRVGETYLGTPSRETDYGNLGFPAPQDWIPERDVMFTDEAVILDLQGVEKVRFAGTGSMLPVLDDNTTGIMAPPASPDDVKIGDILLYYDEWDLIVHRVVKTDYDEKGWYAITKGDNNDFYDAPVRWDKVKSVLIGVLW